MFESLSSVSRETNGDNIECENSYQDYYDWTHQREYWFRTSDKAQLDTNQIVYSLTPDKTTRDLVSKCMAKADRFLEDLNNCALFKRKFHLIHQCNHEGAEKCGSEWAMEKLRLQAKEILQDGNDNDADQDIVAKAKLRGNAYYRENRFEDAIAEYKKSLSILETFGPLNDSDSQMKAILYTNLASSYENLCDYQSAIDCCTKATDIKPMYAKGHFRLGSIHAKLDDLPNAIEHYATALSIFNIFMGGSAINLFDRYFIIADWTHSPPIHWSGKRWSVLNAPRPDGYNTGLTLNPGWIPGLINQVDMLIGKLGNKFAEEEIKKVKPMVPTNNHLRQSLIREMFSDDIFASDFIDKFVGCDLPTVRKIIASIRNDELNFALEQVKLLQLNYSEKPLSNDELLILLIKSTIHLFFAKFGYALLDLNVIIDHLAERELNSIEKKLLLAAYVRRSYVHTNNGNIETALIDTDKAIAIDPERPYTHCYKGQLSIIYRNYEGACTCLE
ncbi:hypothetical protein ACOME3_009247 [Neoechinorhynchus agilis]